MRKPSYSIHNGFRMPMGFPETGLASALKYQARPDDIFVSTYPKCGTTWTQHIVWLIIHRGIPLSQNQRLDRCFPHIEEVGAEFLSSVAPPRLLKTHLPFDMTPWNEQAKYIYVVRNPFDCAVSFYHHTRGFSRHYDFAEGSFDEYFECFVAGEVDFGDYFDSVLSWLREIARPNVLLLTYESMSADRKSAIKTIAHFLGLDDAISDAKTMQAIIEHSSFSQMSKDQKRWSSERPDTMPPFVRKGIVGDWQNHFSRGQIERLLDRAAHKDPAGQLTALWPEIFALARASI